MTDIYPFKYKTVRVFPSSRGSNASTVEEVAKFKIDTLEEYIDKEAEALASILEGMSCEKNLSKDAVEALRKAMFSANCSRYKKQ